MRKAICYTLAAAMVFSMAACSKKNSDKSSKESSAAVISESSSSAESESLAVNEEKTPVSSTQEEEKPSLNGLGIKKDKKPLLAASGDDYDTRGDEEFGGVFLGISIEEFNASGFAFGDSVDIKFSNGAKFLDLPYYNGYYVNAGENLLIGYPGYGDIKLAQNYGKDLYIEAGLKEGDTASITLNEKGKYLDIQKAMDISYKDDRDQYPSDIVFANFRNVTVGKLKEGVVYRSASPVDNQHMRAKYADALAKEAGVKYDIDLSDNETKLQKHMAKDDFDSPHFLSLYEDGKVIPLAMSMNYFSDDFLNKICLGFRSIAENEGPYLIHCVEGKDRTGFFLMLLEAFAGASYQEIVDDYMITYDNYFEITKEKDPEKYNVLKERNLDRMIKFVCGDDDSVDITTADLKAYAESFLKKTGLSDEELVKLAERLVEAGK